MTVDAKYTHKASYRINNRIKSIINSTFRDIQRETGLKLSLGRVSRAFWVSMAGNPALRKRFIDSICKVALQEAAKKNIKYYYVRSKRTDNKQGYQRRRKLVRQK